MIALAALQPALRRLRRQAKAAAYAIYASIVFWLLAPPTWLIVILLPRPSWAWRVLRVMLRLLALLLGTRVRASGVSHIGTNGPAVLVANHASYVDGMALIAILPRPVTFVAKSEFRRHAIAHLFFKHIGAVFVERFNHEASSADAQRLVQAARAERPLFLFVEGTFTRVPGLRPFHLGAFMAAGESGVPVIPLALRGTRSVLRDGSWFPRHATIQIAVGEPIDPAALPPETRLDPWRTALALRDRAREYILHHCGEPDLS